MARIRTTTRWGNSDIIMLKPQDKVDLDIEIGKDEVDLEDMIIIKRRKKK